MEVLTDKQFRQYDRTSRYAPFPIYYNSKDEKYVYGISAHLKTDNSPHVVHTVAEGDTLDTLSLHYYNNPTYYWIIADANKIQDPYEDLVIGTVLRIPTFGTVEFDMR